MAAPAISPHTDRKAWLDARAKVITATDIAAIAGVSPWKSEHEVWLEKTGQKPPEGEESDALRLGRALEPVIAQEYAERNGVKVAPAHFVQMEGKPFGATPDYWIHDEDSGQLLEIKTAGAHMAGHWGEDGGDQIPDQYITQVMWQMLITGADECHVAVLIGGQDYRQYLIPRRQALIDRLAVKAEAWWSLYIDAEHADAPPLSGTPADKEWLKDTFPEDTGEIIRADEKGEELIDTLQKAFIVKAAADENFEAAKANVQAHMGDASILEHDGGRISWKKSKDSRRTDWQKLARSLGATDDQIAEHSKPQPGSRRFLHGFKAA